MARLYIMLSLLNKAYELDEEEEYKRRRLAAKRRLFKSPARNEDFMKVYRLSKELVESLEDDLYSLIPSKTRNTALPIRTKILSTLSFLANSGYQNSSNINALVSQPSMSRALHQIIDALCHPDIVKKYIRCPQNITERQAIKDKFLEKFNIPNVIGCIGSTLVALCRPTKNDEEYYCSKRQHGINVQLICDADLNITQVNSSFGAALSNSDIFDQSSIKDYLENLHVAGQNVYLLGNSNYPQRPYLMTPIQNAKSGTPAAYYNKLHTAAYNNTIQQLIQTLKARFRCLLVEKPLHYHPDIVGKIVISCCILHNICNKAGLPAPELSDKDLENESKIFHKSIAPKQESGDQASCCRRNTLVNKLTEINME